MKSSTKQIIKTLLNEDGTISESHRKALIQHLSDPQSATLEAGNGRQMLSLTKAAKAFDMSPRTLRRMIDRGEVEAHRFTSHTIRIDLADLSSVQAEKQTKNLERNTRGRFVPKEEKENE